MVAKEVKQLDALAYDLEKSIRKTHRKDLWVPMIEAIRRYRLLEAGDRVAVCVSGGKDSMLLAIMMQLLQKHSEFPFEVVFLAMDPGFCPENRQKLEENARLLSLPLTVFETDIFQTIQSEKSPCYLCARQRRGHLYAKAKSLGCNKIALGHHKNDVVETTLMGMLYGGQLQAMLPKLKSHSFPAMELIRPLYRLSESDICAWAKECGLSFLDCACPVTKRAKEESDPAGARAQTKEWIRRMKEKNPRVEDNIFHSIHTLSPDTFPNEKNGFDAPVEEG